MTNASQMLPGMSVRRLSDEDGCDHIQLIFPRTGNRGTAEIIEPLSFLGQEQALKNRLWRAGYKLDASMSARTLIAELQRLLPDDPKPLLTGTGWIGVGAAFAFPDEVIGTIEAELLINDNVKANSISKGGVSGKLSDWQRLVAEPALKSRAASVTIMTAFASPLLRYSDLSESFTLNIAGESSSGKSTAVAAAISVWGSPKNCLSWDATAGAVADLAVANSGLGLFLDDVEKQAGELAVKVKRVRDVIHKIVSGSTRKYTDFASRDPSLQLRRYECIAFCSSPDTIEKLSRSAGKPLLPSERVRFLEVRVPIGNEGGIFATPAVGDVAPDTRLLVKALKAGAETNYGKPGRKWVRYLVKHASNLRPEVSKLSSTFLRRLGGDVGAIDGRIADKFALVFAAGTLAARAGILPWSEKIIARVALQGYHDAIEAAFPDRFDTDAAMLRIEALVMDRQRVNRTSKPLNLLKKGQREGYIARGCLYLRKDVFEQALRAASAESAPPREAIEQLYARLQASGALLKGHGGRTQDVRISGSKEKRLVFDMTKLESEFGRCQAALRRLRAPAN